MKFSRSTLLVAVLLASLVGCAAATPDSRDSEPRTGLAPDHPAFMGSIGDAQLLTRLSEELDHRALLEATGLRTVLGEALAAGVITGYDLRPKGIFDEFPPGEWLIYSHSSLEHVRALVRLLDREGVHGSVYLTPKVSAFLYREDWGSAGDNVITLPSGVRVVQGQEMAVLFQFPNAADRARFHRVINRYAKRDSEDETGLIVDSWWQPFYYTDEALDGFEPIALVLLTSADFETTLTVVDEKADAVMAAFKAAPWSIRREQVWVNPAFFRFLNGDYK